MFDQTIYEQTRLSELTTMSNSKSDSEKTLNESENVESNDQRAHRVQPNRVARRLPTGEIPTSKNTLRSFESSSYPQPVTSATAIVNSEKASSEEIGEIVNDSELDTTEFSGDFHSTDEPIVDAVAAPVLEEAEAILFEDNVVPPESLTIVDGDENPTPRTKRTQRQRLPWMIVVVLVVVVVAIVVAVALSVSNDDGNSDVQKVKDPVDGSEDELSPPTLSPTNSTMVATVTSSPTITRNSSFPTGIPSSEPSMIFSAGPSAFPSSIEDTVRANLFVDFINVLSLTRRTIRNARYGTSEDAALNWLITSDPWNRSSTLETASERFRVRQRYALSTLYFQSMTGMATTWANSSGWLVDENECHWYGINCTVVDLGDEAGAQMAVTSINLQQQNMTGTLSLDLGLLTSIQNFQIYDNALFGTIPDTLDRWTNLTTFYVFRNEFTGTLPFSIGQWSKLQQISVTFNQLTGTLPSSIVQWTNLIYFSVANNQLNGTIPDDVGQWTNLDVFILRHNLFSGTLPSTIGQWTVLQYINITENQITGTIPDTISQWNKLQTLTFRDNLMTGTLPPSIGSLTKLWFFDVSSNFFSGTIPASIGNWSSRVQHMALEYNNFTGFVPLAFCNETIATVIQADCLNGEVSCECCTECF